MGTPRRIELTGQRFGRLVVKSYAGHRTKGRAAYWQCDCDCGGQNIVAAYSLRNGSIASCGCLQREQLERRLRHGHAKRGAVSATYSSWIHMRARCYDPNHKHFSYYGGRGIQVCARWFKFENFLADMGESGGLTLDRINGNLHYMPSNCRWATRKEQANNKT